MKELLKKLTQIPGPSGYESAIRDAIREEIKPYVTEMRVDALGNLIVRMGERKENGMRIMVAAHMDEIGVMVSHVEKNGTVRFSNLGSILARYLPGSRVRFLNGVRGTIDSVKADDQTKIQPLNKFFIDVGATSEKNCPVKPGDVAVFDREFSDLGQRVTSKAMDDRSSCALLIEAIKNIKETPNELYLVFSVQEEVTSRGATTAAYGLDVDLGLALDVTPVGHLLGIKMQVDIGKGPAIKVRDVGFIADRGVVNWMVESAKVLKIPYQMEVLDIGSTDARVMQISKNGLRSGALSLPCRYVHSPSEMIDMVDYEQALKLLTKLLSQPVKLK
jgi:putative aminopeptidase FrvX